jgi:hypothetical protein
MLHSLEDTTIILARWFALRGNLVGRITMHTVCGSIR